MQPRDDVERLLLEILAPLGIDSAEALAKYRGNPQARNAVDKAVAVLPEVESEVYYSIAETARIFRKCTRTIKRWAAVGKIRLNRREGCRARVSESEVKRLLRHKQRLIGLPARKRRRKRS